MKKFKIFIITIFLLSFQILFSQEAEMVTITLLRKNVQVIVNGESKVPKVDEEFPLTAKVQSDGMGFLEFKYKDEVYRVEKNTTILLSEVIKSAGNKNFKPDGKTDPAGVRGADVNRKKNKKQKPKRKVEEDK
jgi:hypothetical protein